MKVDLKTIRDRVISMREEADLRSEFSIEDFNEGFSEGIESVVEFLFDLEKEETDE